MFGTVFCAVIGRVRGWQSRTENSTETATETETETGKDARTTLVFYQVFDITSDTKIWKRLYPAVESGRRL